MKLVQLSERSSYWEIIALFNSCPFLKLLLLLWFLVAGAAVVFVVFELEMVISLEEDKVETDVNCSVSGGGDAVESETPALAESFDITIDSYTEEHIAAIKTEWIILWNTNIPPFDALQIIKQTIVWN